MSSYIFFCLATDADEVNAIIESNGYGPDSVSVALVHNTTQALWVGTHSFVDLFIPQARFQQVVTTYRYESGEPLDNWNDALLQADLSVPVATTTGTPTASSSGIISGTPTQGSTLTYTPTQWVGADSVEWVWRRDGSRIVNTQGDLTYRLKRRDKGTTITVRNLATNQFGTTRDFSNALLINP